MIRSPIELFWTVKKSIWENFTTDLWMKTKISGKTCPYPGSLPHGNWTCEMQEIPILGTSFLDEEAQSYPGELDYQQKTTNSSYFFVRNPEEGKSVI